MSGRKEKFTGQLGDFFLLAEKEKRKDNDIPAARTMSSEVPRFRVLVAVATVVSYVSSYIGRVLLSTRNSRKTYLRWHPS